MDRLRLYPPYTTLERVKAELPPRFDMDTDLPDELIWQYIESRASELDGELARYYLMPARRLSAAAEVEEEEAAPATDPLNRWKFVRPGWMPSQLEHLNRMLAVDDCLTRLLALRQNAQDESRTSQKDQADALLAQIRSGDLILTYPFLHPGTNQPEYLWLAAGSPLYGKHPLSAKSRVEFSYAPRTFSRDTRW